MLWFLGWFVVGVFAEILAGIWMASYEDKFGLDLDVKEHSRLIGLGVYYTSIPLFDFCVKVAESNPIIMIMMNIVYILIWPAHVPFIIHLEKIGCEKYLEMQGES